MKNKVKKLILLPLVGMLLIAVACGEDKPEKDKAAKDKAKKVKPKDEYSQLEELIDNYCTCIEEEEDPSTCDAKAKAVNVAGLALGEKLRDETKNDKEKEEAARKRMGDLFKKFTACEEVGNEKEEE